MQKEDEWLLKNQAALARQARDQGGLCYQGFLDPRQQLLLQQAPRGFLALSPQFYGGYATAERRLALFLPDGADAAAYLAARPAENPLGLLRVTWRGRELNHRDLLGALLALGIKRDRLGDLLLHEGQSADILHLCSLSSFLLQEFRQAGRLALQTELLPLTELRPPQLNLVEKRQVVSTPRLDAVCAACFRLSRSEAAEAIRAGQLARNHAPCLKPDQLLQPEDTLALRGHGKIRLLSLQTSGKKGRIAIIYQEYR